MTANIILTGLAALCTLAAVWSSIASRGYARQAKAAAERAAAARQQAAALRRTANTSEPTPLTYQQLVPLAAALRRREDHLRAGVGLLAPPFPICPTCGQQPTELVVRNDDPAHSLEDRVTLGFRPCGHNFTADGDDLHRAYEAARSEAP